MNINIILSAKLIEQELQSIFGKIPPALIPFSGVSAIDELYKRTYKHFDKQYIVLYENKKLAIDQVKSKKLFIDIIELDKISSLGYSVLFAIKHVIAKNHNIKNLTISFADTLINEEYYSIIMDKNCFLYTITIDSERWTTFDNKEQFKINDKKINLEKEKFNTFIGTFNFIDFELFCKVLSKSVKMQFDSVNMDPFYTAIKEFNKLKLLQEYFVHDWIDLGHEDLYYEAKKNVSPRFFNNVIIDKKKGILTKTSKEKETFANEIRWYLQLPTDLQYLSPRIFSYNEDYSNQFVKMEYYGYNTVHELYLYGNHSTEKWKFILNSLLEVNDEFRKFKLKKSKDEINNILYSVYLQKTVNRLENLSQDKNFKLFFNTKEIIINDKTYNDLSYYIRNLKKILEDSKIYDLDSLNVIHGDYFFANILYDIKGNIIRLIDPRGDFGGAGIYGDYRYDIAKLSHSVLGDYDFIIDDLFEMSISLNKIIYNVNYTDIHLRVKALFKEMINERYDIFHIELIESLLFLSMIPLHSDAFSRQIAFMCIGIKKLDDIILQLKKRGYHYD